MIHSPSLVPGVRGEEEESWFLVSVALFLPTLLCTSFFVTTVKPRFLVAVYMQGQGSRKDSNVKNYAVTLLSVLWESIVPGLGMHAQCSPLCSASLHLFCTTVSPSIIFIDVALGKSRYCSDYQLMH